MTFFQNIYADALFIGLVAGIVMSVLSLFANNLFRKQKINLFQMAGSFVLSRLGIKARDRGAITFGMIVHLVRGALLGLFYILGALYLGYNVGMISGLVFSLLPWLVLMLIAMPLMGHRVFAKKLGRKFQVTTLVLHLIFGAVLGYLAGML